ncbi:MutS-related protein [Segatella bryantii]|uniref:MutS-related protein n=1 Tax=Segatella bryantii TaxID=77095 RepID=UPI00242F7904|nr:DNA mismatch repair protein MutS [Segatella bryantii]
MTKKDLHTFYSERASKLHLEIVQLKKYTTPYIIAELVAFALIIVCFVAYTLTDVGIFWFFLAAVFMAVYIVIRNKDVATSERVDMLQHQLRVYEHELQYLSGDFSAFDAGEEFVDVHHPFSFDMDIFGKNSLYHRINRTVTTGGSTFLAQTISNIAVPSKKAIDQRREAIAELAKQEPLRTAFIAGSKGEHIVTEEIFRGLQEVKNTRIPRFAMQSIALVVAFLCLGMSYGLIAGTIWGSVSGTLALMWIFFLISLILIVLSRPLSLVNKTIHFILPSLSKYIGLIILIMESQLKSAEIDEIKAKFQMQNDDAVTAFNQLKSILDDLDKRNSIWIFLSNMLYLSDFFIVRRYLKWQQNYMANIEDWIDAVSHFDALVSMATFRFNEPDSRDAEIVDVEQSPSAFNKVVYQARGLYHPFLGAKAVRNDFNVKDKHYYIVTGANMAGKSTFLRALGINCVLAFSGMPVFAETLQISCFALFSSMRTTDNLNQGISYFNAELLRLKQLIAYCKEHRSTFIILDEILKGTNSLDKLNGSRLFLEYISSLPVTGVVATHDLELSRLSEERPDRFSNYCFEIQLSDKINYTYKISDGVACNQNATYLLKNILEDEFLHETK